MTEPLADRPPNNILAVASGKGGVGKTWLSITLAHLFARSGRRVLLFDGDIGLANVDVQLGLTPQKDIGSVINGDAPLKEAITHYNTNFDIIAGRSGSVNMASLSLAKLGKLKNDLVELSKNYDFVIIDLGAGIEQYVQFMASIASRCIVVLTDEPTSLTDGYAFIKLCSTKLHNPQISIVVNQAASQKEGEKTFGAIHTACVNFLKISPALLGIIRKDNKVKDAIRAQTPLIEIAAHTTAATDAAAISIKLMQKTPLAMGAPPGGIGGIQIIAAVTTASASGNSSEVPVALEGKADGTLITGTTAGRNANGAVILRTPQGDIALSTELYLKRGMEVMLQLDRSGGQTAGGPTSARIVTVDGVSLGKYVDSMQQGASEGDSVHTSSLGNPSLAADPVKALAAIGATPATAPGNPAAVEARLVGPPVALSPALLATLPPTVVEALATAAPGSALVLTVVQMSLPGAGVANAEPVAVPVGVGPTPSAVSGQPPAVASPALASPAIPPAAVSPLASVNELSPPALAPTQLAGLAVYGKATSGGVTPAGSTLPPASPAPPSSVETAVPPVVGTAQPAGATPSPLPATLPVSTPMPTPVSTPIAVAAAPVEGAAQVAVPAAAVPPEHGAATPSSTAPLTTNPAAGTAVSAPTVARGSAVAPGPSPAAAAPASIGATVIGASGPGEVLLQTPVGMLKLMNTPPLPVGTRLEVRIDAVSAQPVASTAPQATAGPLPLAGLDALQEADSLVLSEAAMQAQTTATAANLLPRPGREMLREMISLFSLLKGDTDIRKWLGEKRIDALGASARPNALGRVEAEIGALRSNFAASSADGWNQMLVPLQVGGQVEPVQLFWKRRRADPAKLGGGDQEHFLIDLTLSRWGRLQLDGLVKKQTPLGFDLIVRSEHALRPEDERSIGEIYRGAAGGAGFTGSLMFRHGAAACVALPNQAPRGDHSIIV